MSGIKGIKVKNFCKPSVMSKIENNRNNNRDPYNFMYKFSVI